jgi:hypothetical protein
MCVCVCVSVCVCVCVCPYYTQHTSIAHTYNSHFFIESIPLCINHMAVEFGI